MTASHLLIRDQEGVWRGEFDQLRQLLSGNCNEMAIERALDVVPRL